MNADDAMVDPQQLNKRIDLMKNEAQAYILAQKQDFDAAFSSDSCLPPKKQKDFEKTLSSVADRLVRCHRRASTIRLHQPISCWLERHPG
ncbi:hypothetical protein WJ968_14345 [Achromobacter xylosoxidans]|jgi:hypothetical protein